jgi:hypothetical protein
MNSGSLEFIDVVAKTELPASDDSDGQKVKLKAVFDTVSAILGGEEIASPAGVSKLVILDDITTLHWIGFPLLDLTRFSRALRALCLKVLISTNYANILFINFHFFSV